MKITDQTGVNVGAAYGRDAVSPTSTDRTRAERARPIERAGDAVELSPSGRDLLRVKSGLRELPDVREDRVAELKTKIAAGNYLVEAEQLAKRLLGLD